VKIIITWEITGGGCEKALPQETIVDTDDYSDSDEDWESIPPEEREIILQDAVQDDFEALTAWYVITERVIKKETK
jgi:hypothetical protein